METLIPQLQSYGPLVDRELELVIPNYSLIDAMLQSCQHPLTQLLMPQQSHISRLQWELFIAQNVLVEKKPLSASSKYYHSFHFWMKLRSPHSCEIPIAGALGLRLGHDENLELYLGHLGYHVLPPARGHHFAERACRLVLPIARQYGFQELWITTNPDNTASRRTIEHLGGVWVNQVDVPPQNPLYAQGDRQKYRYRLSL